MPTSSGKSSGVKPEWGKGGVGGNVLRRPRRVSREETLHEEEDTGPRTGADVSDEEGWGDGSSGREPAHGPGVKMVPW